MTALGLLALGHFIPAILQNAAGAKHSGAMLRFAAFSLATAVLFVAAFVFFGRKGAQPATAVRGPLFPRSFLLAVLVVAVYGVWVMHPAAAAVALVVAIVIALEIGLRDMVYFYWRQDDKPEAEQGALPAIVLSLARFLVALGGIGAAALALGFGAQALVRDVIAGIFYLADDAFCVGEYIEGGGNTKGTVERITLRSVALRHHNGPLHFVPYGSLGSVRNTSRDWVIDKFNLPLPIDVESEKIRKLIKKIGEEMKTDTAIGQHIIEPLKGKLYHIDPGVKIFRCEFRSPPGKQFDIRAAALKRIEAALKEMGVGHAAGVNTVVVKG